MADTAEREKKIAELIKFMICPPVECEHECYACWRVYLEAKEEETET